jgi:hypothetical protein
VDSEPPVNRPSPIRPNVRVRTGHQTRTKLQVQNAPSSGKQPIPRNHLSLPRSVDRRERPKHRVKRQHVHNAIDDDTVAYADSVANTNPESYPASYADSVADTNPESYADSVADTNPESYAASYADSVADANPESYAASYADSVADTNPESDANPQPHANSAAGGHPGTGLD